MYSFTFCIQLCGCLRQGEIANRIRFKRWALLRQRFIGLWRQLQRSWCRLLINRYLHTVSNRPCRRFWSRFVGCGVLLHALVLQSRWLPPPPSLAPTPHTRCCLSCAGARIRHLLPRIGNVCSAMTLCRGQRPCH